MDVLRTPHCLALSAKMTTTILTAEQMAEQQLLAAIRLWHEHEYVSSITLAGAAEEILGKRLRKKGIESTFDNVKNSILSFTKKLGDDDPATEKIVAELINKTKNELKHYSGEESLEFDLYQDSIEIIERAITNYHMLMGMVHEDMMCFWGNLEST